MEMQKTGYGLIGYADAARLLGLSEITLRKYVSRGIVPHYKIGARVQFKPGEIESWIEARRRGPRVSTVRSEGELQL